VGRQDEVHEEKIIKQPTDGAPNKKDIPKFYSTQNHQMVELTQE
jgi:hypothetical protein